MKKNIKHYTFKVEGMSCQLVQHVLNVVVNKLDGVWKGAVNFSTEKLTLI